MSYVVAPPKVTSIPVVGGGEFPVRRVICVGRNYEAHARDGSRPDARAALLHQAADAVIPRRFGRRLSPETANPHYGTNRGDRGKDV